MLRVDPERRFKLRPKERELGAVGWINSGGFMAKRVLRTKLCDMLGIEYPVIAAGMGPTLIGETTGAPVDLVVAVSEAGGMGVLGGSGCSVETLRDAIREIKAKTKKSFGVDLLLPQK